MSSDHDNKTLLQTLQSLYSQLMLLVFHRRMNSYRKDRGAQISSDIARPLAERMEKLAAAKKPDNEGMPPKPAAPAVQTATQPQPPGRPSPDSYVAIITKKLSPFSRHLKQKGAGSVAHPEMAEKLKKSARDHLRHALRLARQGNLKAAQLEAEFASNAITEAAHYMSDDEYLEFTEKINREINESNEVSS